MLAILPLTLVAIGPPTLVLDRGEGHYLSPDSAFPCFQARDGKMVAVWGAGRPTRYVGTCLDDMEQSGPCPAPVTRLPGIGADWDSSGTWMLATDRAPDGTLVALTHAEDHTFEDGGTGEWNSSSVLLSRDDGRTWTNLGQVCGAAKPKRARFGGLDLRAMVWNRARRSWLAYSGAYAFESKDPHAAPGTWYGCRDGAFNVRIDPAQPAPVLSEAPGLPIRGSQAVTWGSLSWNEYLKKYLYVWREPGGAPRTVLMALSADGLRWEPPTVLYAMPNSEAGSLDYPTLLGASSALTGRDCLLVYAKAPSTGLRRKDMVERWVHFGPLARPKAPNSVQASGRPGRETAVTVSWSGVPMARTYEVWRGNAANGTWALVGTVRSSSARPEYVDHSAVPGNAYLYRVFARNDVGASKPSRAVSGGPVLKTFAIQGEASGLVLERDPSGEVSLQPSVPGRAAQAWRFSTDDGRRYRIVDPVTGAALDDGSGLRGARLKLTRSPGSEWRIEPAGAALALIADRTGLCLDALGNGKAPSTPLNAYPYRGAPNQRWRIVTLSAS